MSASVFAAINLSEEKVGIGISSSKSLYYPSEVCCAGSYLLDHPLLDRDKLGQNQVYFFSVVDGLSHDMKSLEILDRDALKAMSSHGVTEVSRKEGDRMPWLASWKGDFGLVLGSADLAIKFIRGPYFDQLQDDFCVRNPPTGHMLFLSIASIVCRHLSQPFQEVAEVELTFFSTRPSSSSSAVEESTISPKTTTSSSSSADNTFFPTASAKASRPSLPLRLKVDRARLSSSSSSSSSSSQKQQPATLKRQRDEDEVVEDQEDDDDDDDDNISIEFRSRPQQHASSPSSSSQVIRPHNASSSKQKPSAVSAIDDNKEQPSKLNGKQKKVTGRAAASFSSRSTISSNSKLRKDTQLRKLLQSTEKRVTFYNIFEVLKANHGWSFSYSWPRHLGPKVYAEIYFQPGRTVHSQDMELNRDYFFEQDLVLDYLKREVLGMVKKRRGEEPSSNTDYSASSSKRETRRVTN